MTKDEIIEMAIQAEINLYVHDLTEKQYIEVIETFARLVAAKERESCAEICDPYVNSSSDHEAGAAMNIQDAIRARGEA
jgi:hypothetical protein